MPVYPSQAMLTKGRPGGLYRKQTEDKAKAEALPEGKGELGSLSRGLVEEPLERPVAPGAKKIVGVKPSIEEPTAGLGFLSANAQSVPGEVAGPESMGMFASSGKAPKASSGSGGGGSRGSSGGKSASAVAAPSVAVRAPAPSKGSTTAPSENRISGSLIAGPEEKIVPAKRSKSEQEDYATKSSLPSRVKNEGVKTFVTKTAKDPVGAVKGVAERVKKTVENVVNKSNVAYQNRVQKETTAQKIIRGVLRSLFG